jgi:hypothetical protein
MIDVHRFEVAIRGVDCDFKIYTCGDIHTRTVLRKFIG